jgi:Helicase conserved C-terminal domain
LSATPHDGSARSFASLTALLDPTAISDPDDYTPRDYRDKGLVIRRFKKDIRGQVTGDFKERRTIKPTPQASAAEEDAYRALLAIRFTQGGTHRGGTQQELQRLAMQKAIFSSPFAALESTHKRIHLLTRARQPSADERQEVADLQAFAAALGCIDASHFSKYQRLLAYLTSAESGWALSNPADRVVVFSERLETLRWLHGQLRHDLRLRDQQITLMHGQLPDTAQQEVVKRFGRREDPLRLLFCSDVASEGLNLHYFCHRLIHFDLPWSLMVFQQRNGRVDRYGQAQEPQILYLYLFTATQVEKIRGDLRILEILQQKDEQANTQANEGDWLLQLFGGGTAAVPLGKPLAAQSRDHIEEWPGLFKGEYHFATAALAQLAPARDWLQWTTNETAQGLAITAPLDLQERLQQLPREVRSSNNRYELCADPARLKQAIEQARQARAEDDTWPQHPIVDWLVDRVITLFGRHRAPVIQSNSLQPGEQAFVMMELVPNRKGHRCSSTGRWPVGSPHSRLRWSPTRLLCGMLVSRPAGCRTQGRNRRCRTCRRRCRRRSPAYTSTWCNGRPPLPTRCSSACRARWRTWSACKLSKYSSWKCASRSSWSRSGGANSSAAAGSLDECLTSIANGWRRL